MNLQRWQFQDINIQNFRARTLAVTFCSYSLASNKSIFLLNIHFDRKFYSRKLGQDKKIILFRSKCVSVLHSEFIFKCVQTEQVRFLNRRASVLMHTSVRHVIPPCCYNAFQSSREPFHFFSAVFLLIERPILSHVSLEQFRK